MSRLTKKSEKRESGHLPSSGGASPGTLIGGTGGRRRRHQTEQMRITLFFLHGNGKRGEGVFGDPTLPACVFCVSVFCVSAGAPGVININQNKHSLVMFWVTFISPFSTRERSSTKGVSQEYSRCPTLLEIKNRHLTPWFHVYFLLGTSFCSPTRHTLR